MVPLMLFPVFITILRITGGFLLRVFIFPFLAPCSSPGSGIFPASVPAAPFFMVPAAVLLCKLLYFADGMLCAPVIGGAGIQPPGSWVMARYLAGLKLWSWAQSLTSSDTAKTSADAVE